MRPSSRRAADHPRLRGENSSSRRLTLRFTGPPPPARGEPALNHACTEEIRTTPACAGRTLRELLAERDALDHPRLRGENVRVDHRAGGHFGPPPPARGERVATRDRLSESRTTPACAGRTGGRDDEHWIVPDHPRLRGENSTRPPLGPREPGPPPPARGEPHHVGRRVVLVRTTPACAGRTPRRTPGPFLRADHPRLRGENACRSPAIHSYGGPPPPARGERGTPPRHPAESWTTPACAGRTARRAGPQRRATDHPRLRGENAITAWNAIKPVGPPPPARGERRPSSARTRRARTTPACAGRTL